MHNELLDSGAPLSVRSWAQNPPAWLEQLSPSTALTAIPGNPDEGEAEAIALAEELHSDWLLIDEAAGRDEAVLRGLRTIGTLGILREAHRAKLLDLRTTLSKLKSVGFYASETIIAQLLTSID